MRALAASAVLLYALAASADEPERPWLFGTVAISPYTSFPDLLSATVTVHAIPWVDVQAGGARSATTSGWWVRGGPRYLVNDWRDEQQRGLTMRIALLAGYRAIKDVRVDAKGFCAALTLDLAYFFLPHLGVSVQVGTGGTYDAPAKRVVPELRLAVGAVF